MAEYRKLDEPLDFSFELEEKYIGAKQLVQSAKNKLSKVSSCEGYYRIFGGSGEQDRNVKKAQAVLLRVENYCAKIQDLYFDQERRFNETSR